MTFNFSCAFSDRASSDYSRLESYDSVYDGSLMKVSNTSIISHMPDHKLHDEAMPPVTLSTVSHSHAMMAYHIIGDLMRFLSIGNFDIARMTHILRSFLRYDMVLAPTLRTTIYSSHFAGLAYDY